MDRSAVKNEKMVAIVNASSRCSDLLHLLYLPNTAMQSRAPGGIIELFHQLGPLRPCGAPVQSQVRPAVVTNKARDMCQPLTVGTIK